MVSCWASKVDAHPFKHWYENHYGVTIGVKKGKKAAPVEEEVRNRYIDPTQDCYWVLIGSLFGFLEHTHPYETLPSPPVVSNTDQLFVHVVCCLLFNGSHSVLRA